MVHANSGERVSESVGENGRSWTRHHDVMQANMAMQFNISSRGCRGTLVNSMNVMGDGISSSSVLLGLDE